MMAGSSGDLQNQVTFSLDVLSLLGAEPLLLVKSLSQIKVICPYLSQ